MPGSGIDAAMKGDRRGGHPASVPSARCGAGRWESRPLGFDLAPATQVKQKLRIEGATVSHSVCPYCAVGCALLAYTKKAPNGKVELLQIEGDPDSPVNEGRLCPKGASALQLAVSRRRVPSPMYREPGATEWKQVSWDFALDRLAQQHQGLARPHVRHHRRRRQRGQPVRGHRLRRRRRVQLRGGLPRHEADARPGRRPSRATGPCLTRSHGGQFGRHVWPRSHDQPLA